MNALQPSGFPAYFRALWGQPPFDWQTRLLQRVRSDGWPATLDLPTGSGKTAALDIALFALALDAGVPAGERRQPRRIVLVVDRRVVVDQAYERAVHIANALALATSGVLAEVAAALRDLQGDPGALPVQPAILRGGMPRENEWARTPVQPVLLVSTVDQVGSRLLFRGYGVSDGMRPVHAGLLGRDSLFLLDEVHLSRPFEETLEAVARYAGSEGKSDRLPHPLRFVRMSATVAQRRGDEFGLVPEDRAHPVLSSRLRASKVATLRSVETPKDAQRARAALARACVSAAEELASGPACVVAVVVNRVDTARRVAAQATGKAWDGWDVRLVTGRMRPLDRDDLQSGLIERIRAGRRRTEERLLLVSTQAVEAGADFDFDALVTECTSLDALRQRFGRLDRFGELGRTRAIVLGCSRDVADTAEPDAVYGSALGATWRWLLDQAAAPAAGGEPTVDFGIEALEERLATAGPEAVAALLAPRLVAPILTASHLDRWSQTSPRPTADPDVAPFLHGVDRGAPDVQVVWRADLTAEVLRDAELARALLELVPPSSLEALVVPIYAARSWLAAVRARDAGGVGVEVPEVADVEGGRAPEDGPTAGIARAVCWRGEDSRIVSEAQDLHPGDILVVPASYGGLDPRFGCWDPESRDSVVDRGDEAHLRQRGRAVVRWAGPVVAGWAPAALARVPEVPAEVLEEHGQEAVRAAFLVWADGVRGDAATPEWARIALDAVRRRASLWELPKGQQGAPWFAFVATRRLTTEAVRALSALPVLERPAEGAATEDDAGSFVPAAEATGHHLLRGHLEGVEAFTRRFTRSTATLNGQPSDLELAARYHDVGKADPRFQLLLHGGDPVTHALADEPLAKSTRDLPDRAARAAARRRAGYPAGTRHELMSVALVQDAEGVVTGATDPDLVLQLIAAHHGHCRPFAPPALDPAPVEVWVQMDGAALAASSDHGLVRLDSGVAERFWRMQRRYGWWGLAWLEAVLRLADHRESEEGARG